jgi:hypothetical protein
VCYPKIYLIQVLNNPPPPGIPHTLVRTIELHIEDRHKKLKQILNCHS